MRIKNRPEVTQELLRDILDYDPETGIFKWKKRTYNKTKYVMAAGSWRIHNNKKYLTIMVLGKACQAHRLAWVYMYGKWPDGVIDHINGEPSDNRIANLRDVSLTINQQNMKKANKSSTTGLLGVYAGGKRYQAVIRIYGKRKHLGLFDTPEEAHQAYLVAKRKYHEGCTI